MGECWNVDQGGGGLISPALFQNMAVLFTLCCPSLSEDAGNIRLNLVPLTEEVKDPMTGVTVVDTSHRVVVTISNPLELLPGLACDSC